MTRRGLFAVGAATLAAACSPLALFDRFSPKDAAGRRVAADMAYGDDPRQRLDVYAPAGEPPAGGRPILVFFYGGGWSSGDRRLYRWVGRALAARGFVAVLPDYRLSPQVHFPAFVEDAAAAVAQAAALGPRFGGDPSRLLLAGHSAGAYLAVQLALDRRYLQAAGLDPRAVRAVAGLAGPYDFYPFDVPAAVNAFGRAGAPLETQPLTFARGDAPPLFLAAGTRDVVVRPRNSVRLAKAVRAKGGEVRLQLYPGLDHADVVLALSRPFRGKAPVLEDMTAFLHAHAAG